MRFNSASEPKSTSIRPPCPRRMMRTFVPKAKRSLSSAARVCTSFGGSLDRCRRPGRGSLRQKPLDEGFGFTNRQPARNDFAGRLSLRRRVGQRQQRASVPGRQSPGCKIAANFLRQSEQAHEVRDRTAILADCCRDLILRQREVFSETLIRERFIDRVQVLALKILDQSELEQLLVTLRDISDDDRYLAAGQRAARHAIDARLR